MASYLVDTNVLLRAADPGSAQHGIASSSVHELLKRGHVCAVAPQVLIEFWAVASRPVASNGLGWTVAQTRQELLRLLRAFPLLPETPAVFSSWQALALAHPVAGKRVHDLRLLAVAQVNLMHAILTFNTSDFIGSSGVGIVDPGTV